jgi:threonine dehydratase
VIDDVALAAADRTVSRAVRRTPLLPVHGLDRPLWLKAENLQLTGSFKIRGAFNRLSALSAPERAAGVVAHSSGNHAQAVAYAATLLGIQATIVMPETATAFKIQRTREFGGQVVTAPFAEYRGHAEELARSSGRVLVPPFDDDLVIAGQSTVGTEILAALEHEGVEPASATVLAPIGGGGLLAGVATAVKRRSPATRVVGVEPELAGDAQESLRRGRRVEWKPTDTIRTIADGLRTTCLGARTWEHIAAYVDDIVTVSESAILDAVGFLVAQAHLVAEPSGAVTTAGYLSRLELLPGDGPVVAIVSGANTDIESLVGLLGRDGRR